jgi:hypothetical protein
MEVAFDDMMIGIGKGERRKCREMRRCVLWAGSAFVDPAAISWMIPVEDHLNWDGGKWQKGLCKLKLETHNRWLY